MTTEKKIKKILEVIAKGHTVYFTTYNKSTAVNQKTVDKFAKLGIDLFKADGPHILMANGKNYVSMIGAKITFA